MTPLREWKLGDFLFPAILTTLFGSEIMFALIEILVSLGLTLTGTYSDDRLDAWIYGDTNMSYFLWSMALLGHSGLVAWVFHKLGYLDDVFRVGRLSLPIFGLIVLGVAADFFISDLLDILFTAANNGQIPDTVVEGMDTEVSWQLLPGDLFWGAIAAPIEEEFLIRGVLFSILITRGWSVTWTLLITSAFFAILHVQYTIYGIIPVFVAGMIFGLLRIWTGGLAAPIIAHGLVNFLISTLYLVGL
ncbi:MAG: hypothetical protein CMK09_16975 [Ponticaulis sp.]|nr:hypothetical protein [Ponticaulis sp.]|tara:strand:+ start:14822 stop:15559 length:738 start_codon:yes stop_codon:yes gene_type:complete